MQCWEVLRGACSKSFVIASDRFSYISKHAEQQPNAVCCQKIIHVHADCIMAHFVCWIQVEFAGRYPLDGAKVIESTMTRQVARPIRKAAAMPGCLARKGCTLELSLQGDRKLQVTVRNNTAEGKVMQVLKSGKNEL